MHTLIRKALFAVLSAVSVLLISCGGSGGGGDIASVGDGATAADAGTVTLLVTDAPTDDFREIILTIIKAELLSDDGKEELFSGEKKFDLLQLTDVTEIFSVSHVPSGVYNKIRLTLAKIELVFKDKDRPNAYPKLPGNGKLDLNPRENFYVDSSNPLTIQLDFDAEKSIHVKDKEKYNFRPVVFIKTIKDKFDTKLVRQRGIVKNLDGRTEEFDLCLIEAEVQPHVESQKKHDLPDCVRVNTTDTPASIFDDHADPIRFWKLENGDIATVVGRFSFGSYMVTPSLDDSSSDDRSDDHSSDDHSSDDDSSDDNDRPGLVLVAEVIWTGNDITQTINIACSGVTTDVEKGTWYKNYELPVPEDGEVCRTPGARPTVLQPGAKIYDSEGNELDDSSIAEDVLNKVDGVVVPEDKTGDLKAVLVMLGLDNPLHPLDHLTGIIGVVDIDFDNELSNLTLMTDEGDRCVNFDNVETEVFETSLDEDDNINFDQKSVFSLRSGQKANVFGTENNSGCLDADTIIYEDEGAVIQPI